MDLAFLSPIVDAAKSHAYGLVAWLLLTMVVNTVFHFVTPSDADAWAERNPVVAKVAALFRRVGIEPVALIVLVASFFSAKPPPPGPIGKSSPKTPAPPVQRPGLQRVALGLARAVVFAMAAMLLAAGCGLVGCKALFPKGVDSALSDADKLCVIANAAFPNDTIRTICNIEGDVADVTRIIEALTATPRAQLASAKREGFEEAVKTTAGVCK